MEENLFDDDNDELIFEDDDELMFGDDDSDELSFDDEDAAGSDTAAGDGASSDHWKVMIVDDEAEIHKVTKLTLAGFSFENKKPEFVDAYSAEEAKQLLRDNPDVALILLDVIMEEEDSGLQVVKYVREQLNNQSVRIILRTGQPGQAPEKDVILNYDINDYKTKTELTKTKLYTTLVASLRAYKNINAISEMNKNLEQEVLDRTEKIRAQSAKITASITYASRIQSAILTDRQEIRTYFKDSFVLYKPKDIVSGDFYWCHRAEDGATIIAAVDCTGHGVPGAFMTVMANSTLNQIVTEGNITRPDQLLHELDDKVRANLKKQSEGRQPNDGMDLALCKISADGNTLYFAGAKNPLYRIRNGELEQFKGSRFPIGSNQFRSEKIFELHELPIKPGDKFYITSDGYQDQFGGPRGGKFLLKNFRETLLKTAGGTMTEQHEALERTVDQWRGDLPQTDDILVIGFRVK